MIFLPSCREVSKLLSEASDSPKANRLGLHVRLHLSICAVCRRVRAQFALLRRAASRAPEEGPALSPEAKSRLRRLLDQ